MMQELEHHKKAFEYYYSLGEKRSYKAVSKHFGFSLQSVKLWGREFAWMRKLKEREGEVARAMAARNVNAEVSNKIRNKQIIQLALVQLAKAIAEGKVKMNLSDLDRLVRLESFLDQRSNAGQDFGLENLQGKTYEELRGMIKVELEMLNKLGEDCAEPLLLEDESMPN
jgi:transposase